MKMWYTIPSPITELTKCKLGFKMLALVGVQTKKLSPNCIYMQLSLAQP